ncbi:unnamed protein product, partial [Symbiodinium sp. CCMP2456]
MGTKQAAPTEITRSIVASAAPADTTGLIEVEVSLMSGDALQPLSVPYTCPISELKRLIAKRAQITLEDIKLVGPGAVKLEDNQAVGDWNVSNGKLQLDLVRKPAAKTTPHQVAKTVVINCANVGTVYSESRRQLYAEKLSSSSESGATKKGFDWDGVRRAFDFYESHGLQPQGVCKNRTAVLSPVPSDLKSKVIICPIVDDQRCP